MKLTIDFSKPVADLSLAVSDVARAWYIDAPKFSPVVLGDWKGSVAQGGSVNFFNVEFNPHAHGTHTETAGHITKKRHSINKHFRDFMTKSLVLTLPVKDGRVHVADFHAVWKKAEERLGFRCTIDCFAHKYSGKSNRKIVQWDELAFP